MTIKKTHPWITFEIDMRRAPASLWLLLGEANSKCEHLSYSPLKPKFAEELLEVYLAKGVHATTAIEGNTLSEEQVLKVLKAEANTPISQKYLEQEVQNVIDAANEIMGSVMGDGPTSITPEQIKKYNLGILNGIETEDYVVPGEYSKVNVGVTGYRGAPVELCEDLVSRLCKWINSSKFSETTDFPAISVGLIKAIIAHLYLVWIHPFGDGNGRTARLMEVRLLMEVGVPAAAAHLLSNHYNQTRAEYYRQLAHASSKGGDPIPFIQYAVRGFVDQIREQIDRVRMQNWRDLWANYVYESFDHSNTKASKRQRGVVLAMSKKSGWGGDSKQWISKKDISTLTPILAAQYAGLSQRAVSRDINALEKTGLIELSGSDCRARREIILSFLPTAHHLPNQNSDRK